ncbi:mechanosensitive ion channel domain-containing protein [Methylophaga lonarensis]|uniref:mechanosensitive ion channel domain-containing protein n=1 Tax=Methylophaga lonarensis TaxID=999151 RepID=UPI003D2C43CE
MRQFLLLPLYLFVLLLGAMPTAIASEQTQQEESYRILADILEDEQSRTRFIEQLRLMADGQSPEQSTRDVASEEEVPSLARQLASNTQNVAQELVQKVGEGLQAIWQIRSIVSDNGWLSTLSLLFSLSIVIATTLLLFWGLRLAARPLFARANLLAAPGRGPNLMLRRVVAVTVSALLDVAIVLLAWVTGYVIALFVVGETGKMDVTESIFLNAFLLIEVFKVLIRTVFADKDDELRLLPMCRETAIYWETWLFRLSTIIGYGMLMIVPLINVTISPVLGQFVSIVVVIIAFLYALVVILQNRSPVRNQLMLMAGESNISLFRVSLGMLARCWHVLAILYFAILAIALLLRPEDALPMMLKATFQTIVAVGLGIAFTKVISHFIKKPLTIPEETRQSFPHLEDRLNAFVPTVFETLRIIIVVGVIAIILDAWSIFNLATWLGSDAGINTILTLLTVSAILITASLLWIGLASWIEHRLNPLASNREPSPREKTLLTVFRNAASIALVTVTIMVVLAEIGINIGPLLAGAGVLGLAIGFGAQKLVQDVITGVFIQMENGINAGDIITVAGMTGVVEKLTIRSLSLRDVSGTYHLIPFSSVDTVSNFMREYAYHLGVYGIAYREDIDEAISKLQDAFAELLEDPEQRENIIEDDLQVDGVVALNDSSVDIRVRIKTLPGKQFAVGRAYNRLVKQHLDRAGIEIPFPHMTMFFGQEKDGTSPAGALRLLADDGASHGNPARPSDSTDAEQDSSK